MHEAQVSSCGQSVSERPSDGVGNDAVQMICSAGESNTPSRSVPQVTRVLTSSARSHRLSRARLPNTWTLLTVHPLATSSNSAT